MLAKANKRCNASVAEGEKYGWDNDSEKNNEKLGGKDLINIGIYAAIYLVIMTAISMLGFIPIMVMQDVNHQLFCETVMDEVTLGMDEENGQRVIEILDKLGLKELADRHPMSLSGGQKQRVAVASALLSDKDIILFDEPSSGLDFYNMERVAELIRSLRGQKTVFVVTHDPDLVRRCATVVLRLENGHVVNTNSSGEIKDYGREKEKCYSAAV